MHLSLFATKNFNLQNMKLSCQTLVDAAYTTDDPTNIIHIRVAKMEKINPKVYNTAQILISILRPYLKTIKVATSKNKWCSLLFTYLQ